MAKSKIVKTSKPSLDGKAPRFVQPMRRADRGPLAITVTQPTPGANSPPLSVSGTFTGAPAPTITVQIVIGTNPQITCNYNVTPTGNTWTAAPAPGSPALPLNTPLTLIVSNANDASSYVTVAFSLSGPTFTGVTTNSSEAVVTLLGNVAPGTALEVFGGGSFKMVGPDPVYGNFAVTSYATTSSTLKLVLGAGPKKIPAAAFAFNILGPDTLSATGAPSLDVNGNQLVTVSYSQPMADTAFVATSYTLIDPNTSNPPLDANNDPVTITGAPMGGDPTTAVLTLSAVPVTGTYDLTIEDTVTDEAGNPYPSATPVPVAFP